MNYRLEMKELKTHNAQILLQITQYENENVELNKRYVSSYLIQLSYYAHI